MSKDQSKVASITKHIFSLVNRGQQILSQQLVMLRIYAVFCRILRLSAMLEAVLSGIVPTVFP